MTALMLSLVEFPADDPQRARRFWSGLLGQELAPREASQGTGWQTAGDHLAIGVHERGRGPGDTSSLPYFAVGDMTSVLSAVQELGGSVIHPGAQWSICKDPEGNPFALSSNAPGA